MKVTTKVYVDGWKRNCVSVMGKERSFLLANWINLSYSPKRAYKIFYLTKQTKKKPPQQQQ